MNEQSKMKCACCGKDLPHGGDKGCEPSRERLAEMKTWEQEMIEKWGFYIHYVPDCHGFYVDCHTHGLRKSLNHPEIQFVLPLSGDHAMPIMHSVVGKIKEKHHLVDKEKIDEIITNFPVLVAEMKDQECDTYFRIIFPDPKGLFPEDEGCDETYKKQAEERLVW